MSQEPANTENSIEEQLVAYLDGELDGDACRRIEELLAVDPEVRRKLQWLEQTWEVLDELDSTPVGDDFTRTTMEMVALAAEEDVRKMAAEAPRRRRRAWLLTGLGMIIAGAAGFAIFAFAAPNPNRELVKDLPVLENLDEYEQVRDIKFLHLLLSNDLFPKGVVKEAENAPSQPSASHSEDASERVKNLSPAKKAELVEDRRRFAGLGAAQQNQLLQLYEQIERDQNADELRGVMERYYEWFNLLPSYARLDLRNASAEERVNWIKKYKEREQTEITNRPPPGKDSEALSKWMEDYEIRHEKEFVERLPEQMRKELTGKPSTGTRRWIMGMIWLRLQGGQNKDSPFADVDLKELRSIFTPETQKLLEAKPKSEQVRILQNWAHYLSRQRSPRRGPGMDGPVSDEQLAEFFEKDLTVEERDQLMSLSGDDMQQQLQRLYIMKSRQTGAFLRRSDGFAPGPTGPGLGPERRQADRPDKAENRDEKP